jgi:hypothetical protein
MRSEGDAHSTPAPASRGARITPMLVACALLVFCDNLVGAGVTVSIGTARLTLPVPDGYQVLPLEKPDIANAVEQLAPTSGTPNARLAYMVFSTDAEEGKPDADIRSIDFQTMQKCFTRNVTRAYFEEEKKLVKASSANIKDTAQERIEVLKEDGYYDAQSEFENTFLPVFLETERAIGFSLLWKITSTDESGNRQVEESAVTVCMMVLKGKVLYCYFRGSKSDLEWNQQEASKLAEQLVALNPSSWIEVLNEKTGLDNQKAINAGIKWAGFGVIASVLVWVFYKRRGKTESPAIR